VSRFCEREFGASLDGSPCVLEIEVQETVSYWTEPRIEVRIRPETALAPSSRNTWWLDLDEAADLAGWLRSGADRVKEDRPGVVGENDPPSPGKPSWLTVNVDDLGSKPSIQLKFHNRYAVNGSTETVIVFSDAQAVALASLLSRSFEWAKRHPPVVI
jgi:hypothetical protein